MSINDLLARGVLRKQETSKQEIQDLLNISERDFQDSKSSEISYDSQFSIAYNSALKLATALMRGEGFRVKSGSHHMVVISLIPLILGYQFIDDKDYLDSCRRMRNVVEYESVGSATENSVKELREFIEEFRPNVLEFLRDKNLY